MKLSDGAVVPGNAEIDDAERRSRVENFYAPYHRAIEEAVDAALAAGSVPALIAIHSFTPEWKGKARPWHAGILWDCDRRLAAPMLAGLAAMTGIVAGDNEPYSGALEGDTMNTHATARGLAHVLIEIRQDLIGHKSGVDEWAGRLARVIEPIMNDPAIHRIEHH
jgi:predicted N-formylglutamate amidohydrolase